jgi:hypothetical protein
MNATLKIIEQYLLFCIQFISRRQRGSTPLHRFAFPTHTFAITIRRYFGLRMILLHHLLTSAKLEQSSCLYLDFIDMN